MAKEWLTHHPTIKEIEVGDVQQLAAMNLPEPQVFRDDRWEPYSEYRVVASVWDRMTTDKIDTLGTGVESRKWDRQDHSRAVADWVRSFLK